MKLVFHVSFVCLFIWFVFEFFVCIISILVGHTAASFEVFFFMPCLFLLVFPFLASSSSLLVRHTAVQGQKTSSARVNYSKRELGSIGYKRPLFEHTTIIHNQQFANKHKVKSGIFLIRSQMCTRTNYEAESFHPGAKMWAVFMRSSFYQDKWCCLDNWF